MCFSHKYVIIDFNKCYNIHQKAVVTKDIAAQKV